MGKELFIIIVRNINGTWPVKSMVKVTEKFIKCKKIKCHNFDSNVNGENPMWIRHTVTKIFAKNYSVKLVNSL